MLSKYFSLFGVACCLFTTAACSHAPQRGNSSVTPTLPVSVSETENETEDDALEIAGPPLSFRRQALAAYLHADYPRAVNAFEASALVEAKGREPWDKYLLFYSMMAVGDAEGALGVAQELLKAHPYHPLSYQQVGLAQLWTGDAEQAADTFRRALEFESHAPRVHFYLGLAEAKNSGATARDKAFKDAVAEYEQILRKNPKDFTANFELAALYLFWNREIEKASLCLAQAKESLAQNADEELPPERRLFATYYLPAHEGILLYRRGDMVNALPTLLGALGNLPGGAKADLAELYHYLGKVTLVLNNLATSKAFLQRGVRADPNGPFTAEMQRVLKGLNARDKKSGRR